MAVVEKKFTVRYYSAKAYKKGDKISMADLLISAGKGEFQLGVRNLLDQGADYQLRGLDCTNPNEIRGYFVRFREDRPVTGSRVHDVERPIELGEDEEVIEKNHFILFRKQKAEILAYQATMEGGTVQSLSRYLSAMAGEDYMVSIVDIITAGSLEDLLKGKRVQAVEFKVARPTAKKYEPDPDDTWTQDAIDFMNGANATRFEGRIANFSKKRGLTADVVDSVKRLLDSKQTKKLKVKISDFDEPIDLFADRIKDKIHVPLRDGVVVTEDVYKEMWASYVRMESRIAQVMGG